VLADLGRTAETVVREPHGDDRVSRTIGKAIDRASNIS
jgi:hypothetical protein